MAAKRLEFHPAALTEFKAALAWYLERSETAALNFVAELDRAVDLVTKSPRRWPVGEHATRKFILNRFSFAVIYREKQISVQVLAIAHGHRRPGYWEGRL
jgi:plasmid stabilization system protein ParE